MPQHPVCPRLFDFASFLTRSSFSGTLADHDHLHALTAQGAGSAVQTSGGTNNGNSGAAGNGCGNQVANASGINIVCGAKGDAGAVAADPRWLALGVSLTAWFVV